MAAAVLAVACTKTPDVTVTPNLTVDGLTLNENHGLNVEAAASTVTFTVNANVAYSIVSDQDWATPAPAKVENADSKDIKTDVEVKIAANAAEEGRSAKISIVVDGHEDLNYEFTVNQAAAVYEKTLTVLNEDLSDITAAYEVDGEVETTITLSVLSTVSWTAASDQDWLTVTPASATVENYAQTTTTVTLTVAVSDSKEARSAKITFTGEEVEPVKITVNQAANIPFLGIVKLMNVSEYSPEDLAECPDETSLGFVIAASVPVVAGYYGLWTADLWATELEDWESYADDTIESMKAGEYGSAMTDQMIGYINQGGVGNIFLNLDPDTEYILVVVMVDEKGRNFLGYATCKTKAKAPIEYDGFLKIGKYTMECKNNNITASTTMRVKYEGEENKYSIQNPVLNDGSTWLADYDPDTKTLSLNGYEKGYETDGNQFGLGNIYGYFDQAKRWMYGYLSLATEEDQTGEAPCVFTIDSNGYISGLNNYLWSIYIYQMNEDFSQIEEPMGLSSYYTYYGERTVITPEASTSAAPSKFEMAGKELDLKVSKAQRTRVSGLKMVNRFFN